MAAPPSPSPVDGTCPSCGAPVSGRFCSACGTSLTPRGCSHCGATLSPQARFCHRCGEPVDAEPAAARPPGANGRAWLVAAALCAILLGGIVWRVERDQPAPAIPQMANPGAGAAGSPDVPTGAAPDISRMSPRERFDRLFNRIMEAAQRGDSAQVLRFTPMALGAYTQLDTVDADARYHAAVLRLQTGDLAGARALGDTILRNSPGHLLGYVVLGSAAELAGDSAAAARARSEFDSHYAAESAADRPEYRDHAPVIEEFKTGGKAVPRTP
jgi:hypothetical protein